MTTAPRHAPWGHEPLAPYVRAAAVACGADPDVVRGPALDVGDGARARAAAAWGAPVEAWEPDDTPGDPTGWRASCPATGVGLLVAWPGPGHLDARAGWWQAVAASLAPGGVAAVRLDLLPGWHPLTAIQDFARFHGRRRALPLDVALDEVFDLADDLLAADEGRWNGWLRRVRDVRRADPAVAPDLARAPIRPAELHAWVAEAAAAGLVWLGDVRGDRTPGLPAPLRAWIAEEELRHGARPGHGLSVRGAQIADYARHQHTRLALFARPPVARPQVPAWVEVAPAAEVEDRPLRWSFADPASEGAALPAAEGAADPEDLLGAWRDGRVVLRERR